MKRLATLVIATLFLAGCSSVLTATRDTPMEGNQGTRTLGSTLDDQLIETRAGVNIAKAHLDLESASRVSVTSYNGIVLLAGQVAPPGTEGPGRTGRQECATRQGRP